MTAGKIFEGTRKPLRLWFHAIWALITQKYGANALRLQRVLGLGSYVTAWAWLHKLRRAMVRPGRDRLVDPVDVGESYLGALGARSHGWHTITKAILAIAVEMREQGFRRIRLRHVPTVSGTRLTSFIFDIVTPGTTLKTDGWTGYGPLQSLGFQHRVTVHPDSPDPAHVLMPGVQRIAVLLKRGLLRTLQGRISKDHLLYYLDEFTFRLTGARPWCAGCSSLA